MKKTLCTVAATLALTCLAPAQSASYTFFGTGCDPFLVSGLPRPGAQITMTTLGTFSVQRLVLTGFSNTSWAGLPLPFTLPGWCGSLLVSGEIIMPVPPCTNGLIHVPLMLQIPNDPNLLGLSFYQQGVGIAFGGLVTFTRAGHGVIGN